MKKGILLTIALATASLFASAQDNIIPNGGFDNWTSQNAIEGWTFAGGAQRENALQVNSGGQTQTLEPHNGDYYLVLQNPNNGLGTARAAFATTERPTTFEGAFTFFRTSSSSQDRYIISVTLSKWDGVNEKRDTILAANITGPNGGQYPWNYTQLDLSDLYRNTDTPDSCFITIFAGISGVNGQGQIVFTPGTTLGVDALKLNSNTVSVASVFNKDIAVTNYPNPVSDKTTISYGLKSASDVTITVTDITGKTVGVINEGLKQYGEHKVEFDASALKAGIYFYTVRAGESVETRKMIVTK